MISEGSKVPDFELRDTNGKEVRLSDLRGSKVVLYFYPKDMTPGCTKQACSYRDNLAEFKKRGVKVFGVSMDSKERHQKFTEKENLNFPLLADVDHKVSEAFGAYGEKKMAGRTYFGVKRITFILGVDGTIEKVFKNVKPEEDVKRVLEVLDGKD